MRGIAMSKKLATSSIMTALTLVCLFGSAYIPTGKIALLALTSMCMLVTVAESGVRYAWIQYVATSLLALLFIPAKGLVFIFIGLIGYYPILKLHIENIKNLKLEWMTKILFFSALLILAYFFLKVFILNYLSLGAVIDIALANTALVVLILEIAFILYDYFLSFFARFYTQVIKKRLK